MTTTAQKAGFPFIGILQLILITLKLCNVIAWSWWAVLSLIWGPFLFFVFAIVITLIFVSLKGN